MGKIIALGYDYYECLQETWFTPADKVFTAFGETQTFNGPTYDNCLVPTSSLNFEFYDLSGV